MEPIILHALVAQIARKVLNSSSESDDDDDEDLLLFGRRSHNKIEQYVDKTVLKYSIDDFKSHFRLTKSVVEVSRTLFSNIYGLYLCHYC